MDSLNFSVQILSAGMFPVLAVFCRVGSAIMLLPGFGELNVPPRVRLALALMVSVVLAPVVRSHYGPMPTDLIGFAGLLVPEIVVGLALGIIVRMFLMALQVAGNVIAAQTGLSFSQNFDPSIGIQGALLASFFTILGIALIFESNLHHLMLAGLKDSYSFIEPGGKIPFADLADLAARTFSMVFRLGIELSAPQIQIFFITVPLAILAGFSILMMILGSLMMVFIDRFGQMLSSPWH